MNVAGGDELWLMFNQESGLSGDGSWGLARGDTNTQLCLYFYLSHVGKQLLEVAELLI